jgi:hypothetical protein
VHRRAARRGDGAVAQAWVIVMFGEFGSACACWRVSQIAGLYLKIIGDIEEETHSLSDCVRLVEKHRGQKIGSPVREWIMEFDSIDRIGTAFRYADDQKRTLSYAEFWVDFVQLRYAMDLVFGMLDSAILRVGTSGRPPKRKRETRSRKT